MYINLVLLAVLTIFGSGSEIEESCIAKNKQYKGIEVGVNTEFNSVYDVVGQQKYKKFLSLA